MADSNFLSTLLNYGQSFAQGASNSIASNVSAPVDGLAWLLRRAGVPMPSNPVGGSDWMNQRGLTPQPQVPLAGMLGEAAGMAGPMVAAAKAPQIAGGLLKMGENAIMHNTLNNQFGGVKIGNHSPEQMAAWAAEKRARESQQAAQAASDGIVQKAYTDRKVANLPNDGMGQNFNPDQLNSIAEYVKAGDRFGAQAEGRAHTVTAIKLELERLGYPIEKISQKDGGNSIYANINGKMVRVSDHALPMTPERTSNRDAGLLGKWSDEVITDDWSSSGLQDYIKRITRGEVSPPLD